ncbi:ABC transporter substrate-binding protein [uncultured Nocardioides sp.]|uniref:ABC transporter substrate-binding protein n=1 Tax=uncultured Nocardioides sp. TaxID=198441 RepID=UPI0026284C16|nr:ABC transporter substrate-binding protein [uncultured Nocardioides sp.]
MRTPRPTALAGPLAGLLVATAALAACAPVDEADTGSDGGEAAASCEPGELLTITDGTLTVATDTPAYPPYFVDDDPTNGEGFESAVAYAVAEELGFSDDDVTWVEVPFDNSYAPGPKRFDFDINQISITPEREQAVDFSEGYYTATQAVVVLEDGAPEIGSLDDLAGLELGAQSGTTSLTAIRDAIQPDEDPLVFKNTNAATQALQNGQVEAIVADLPTALYITAAQLDGGVVAGQFEYAGEQAEEFGLLLEKGNPLTTCVDEAVTALREDGTLDGLEQEWLSESVDVPVLQ